MGEVRRFAVGHLPQQHRSGDRLADFRRRLQHYSAMFADSRKWLQSGWLDYLAPQVYWYIGQAGSDYKLLVPWWNEMHSAAIFMSASPTTR